MDLCEHQKRTICPLTAVGGAGKLFNGSIISRRLFSELDRSCGTCVVVYLQLEFIIRSSRKLLDYGVFIYLQI